MTQLINSNLSKNLNWARLLGLSSIGIFIFFIPITVAGKQSIPLDHMVSWIKVTLGQGASWYALLMIIAGAIYPIISNEWRNSITNKVFLLLKWLGVVTAVITASAF